MAGLYFVATIGSAMILSFAGMIIVHMIRMNWDRIASALKGESK